MWWFKIRKSVRWFAEMMEMRLRMYDADKGNRGWLYPKIAHPAWLMSCMDEELVELHNAWDSRQGGNAMWREDAVVECLDIANYAMMFTDIMLVRGSYERTGGSVDTS